MGQVREDMEMTDNVIHQRYCVPFLFFKRPQWDKFAGAEDTYAADTLMPDGRTLQLPSTHMLGQNFAKAFGIKYKDEKGDDQYVWQTCYGPAISRIYAAVIATHGDDKGLVFPFDIAPVQVVIVPIYRDDTKERVLAECRKLKDSLSEDLTVRLDDSDDTPGFKFNRWEMKGVPIRLEMGPRDIEKGSVVMVRRDTGEKSPVELARLKARIDEAREDIRRNLKEKADKWFAQKLAYAEDLEELGAKMDLHGFVRVPFCSDSLEAKGCADVIKEKHHANVRGSLFGSDAKPEGKKCISCGKDATIYLFVARQY
jgi:prolyl-tRNA synthetase